MGASTLCLGRTHGTHTPETLQSLSHGGSAGTAGHCHCAGTATLGAGAGGPLGPGTGGAAFWLLSAERRSSRSV